MTSRIYIENQDDGKDILYYEDDKNKYNREFIKNKNDLSKDQLNRIENKISDIIIRMDKNNSFQSSYIFLSAMIGSAFGIISNYKLNGDNSNFIPNTIPWIILCIVIILGILCKIIYLKYKFKNIK